MFITEVKGRYVKMSILCNSYSKQIKYTVYFQNNWLASEVAQQTLVLLPYERSFLTLPTEMTWSICVINAQQQGVPSYREPTRTEAQRCRPPRVNIDASGCTCTPWPAALGPLLGDKEAHTHASSHKYKSNFRFTFSFSSWCFLEIAIWVLAQLLMHTVTALFLCFLFVKV